VPHQFFRRKPDHLAERGIDVRDAPLQVARAQAGHQRVLHGLAKRQRLRQILLGPQAQARVLAQHEEDHHQGDRHGRHQRREHVREQVRRAVPAVDAQHDGVAGQVQQLLRGEHAAAAARHAVQREPGAVGFGEGDFLAAPQLRPDQRREHIAQRVGGDHVAAQLAMRHVRQAQFHRLEAQAVDLRQEVAPGIARTAHASGAFAGQGDVRLRLKAVQARECRRAERRIGDGDRREGGVAPLDADPLRVLAQQRLRLALPVAALAVRRLQGQQQLHVSVQRGLDVAQRLPGIALQLVLHLARLVAAGQPHQRHQHAGDQRHQQHPQPPAHQRLTRPARGGRERLPARRTHSTRCSSAGSCARKLA